MQNKIVVLYPAEKTIVLWRDVDVRDMDFLEQIFAEFNAGSGQECSEFLDAHIRSLSVNDFVKIEENWYQCKSIGWYPVTREFVTTVVEKTENGITPLNSAWSSLNAVMRNETWY